VGDEGRWTLTQGPEVAPLKARLHARRPLVLDQPLPEVAEGGPVSWIAPGGSRADEGHWRRFHAMPDGLVDWSDFCFLPEYRHAVAATVIEVDQPEWRAIEVAACGPVAVWLAGELIGSFTDVSYMEPVAHALRARLPSGCTTLLIATWQAGFREVRHIARVAVGGLPARVVIPSPGADERASAIAESVLDAVATDSWALPGAVAGLSGPAGAALRVSVAGGPPRALRLAGGHAAVSLAGDAADGVEGSASMLSTGETTLTITVNDDRCPVSRDLTVAVLPRRARARPEGTDPGRWRLEVLQHVAGTPPSVARALAAGEITTADLRQALAMLAHRADCADFEAVGLLNLWHAAAPDAWPGDSRAQVKDALLGFKYWIDQPGLDAMCYFTENHQIVFHTAELLAGQAFPGETFANTGWKGVQHYQHG
jgi:hypothetical protein